MFLNNDQAKGDQRMIFTIAERSRKGAVF